MSILADTTPSAPAKNLFQRYMTLVQIGRPAQSGSPR
jgi:hypothetical protein